MRSAMQMDILRYLFRSLRFLATLLTLFGAGSFQASSSGNQPSVEREELLSVGPGDLPGHFPSVLAFDVSPDGRTLAVEFIAADEQGKQILQIGEWNLSAELRKTIVTVEGPAKLLMSNPQFQYDLRFSPDGLDLVALTGTRLVILNAKTLTSSREIGLPSEAVPQPQFSGVLDRFGISGDGSKLAVISRGVGPTCGDRSAFRLFDLKSGELLSNWHFHGCTAGVSLSQNGTHAILSLRANQVEHWRGELVDSATGELLRTFRDGGGVFLDDQRT